MATYDLSKVTVKSVQTGDILNCPYSGTYKQITLPPGKYLFEVWGAQGGYRNSSSYGGKGGYAVGTLVTFSGADAYLYAGGSGNTGKTSGGFNGGGSRATYNGGGGGSDIRINSTSLYARIIVAGGGGSDGGSTKSGGYGGGASGAAGTDGYGTGAGAGTATAGGDGGGTFGSGGAGVAQNSGYGGGGGGGWYGGGGATPDSSGDDDKGGGGGSGYVYTSSSASNYPSGCLLNSSLYLIDASMKAGNVSITSPTGASETGHSGNGYCRITVLEVLNAGKGLPLYVKKNGVWKQATSASIKTNGLWTSLG